MNSDVHSFHEIEKIKNLVNLSVFVNVFVFFVCCFLLYYTFTSYETLKQDNESIRNAIRIEKSKYLMETDMEQYKQFSELPFQHD